VTATESVLAKPQTVGRLPVITPETGCIGASVTNLDIRIEQTPEVQKLLDCALHEHGVLFVRFDGEIGPEDHRRFTRIFGELHESYFNAGDIPLVSVVDSDRLRNTGTDQWHTDATPELRPPQAAALRAILLPEVGGDTMWASMYAAYEALSDKMQRFLQGLEAVHSTENAVRKRPKTQGMVFKEPKSTTHPVVLRDTLTGKPALFVNSNYTERLVGLSDAESASLIKMLLDHINTPDFHVRLKWDTQTIAVWEERITQHRAISDYTGRRILHRTVVDGEPPQPYGEIIR
jgi:taurine dioxygenase